MSINKDEIEYRRVHFFHQELTHNVQRCVHAKMHIETEIQQNVF